MTDASTPADRHFDADADAAPSGVHPILQAVRRGYASIIPTAGGQRRLDPALDPLESNMKRLAFLILCVLLMAGTNPKISRSLAAGAIGCAPAEIGIKHETQTRSIHNFTAVCRGTEYFCSYMYPNPISCKARADQTPQQAATAQRDMAEQMVTWKSTVSSKALAAWERPSNLTTPVTCQMRVKTDDRGDLLNLSWVTPTGTRSVDRSIVNAFKEAAPFPPPPDVAAAFEGIIVTFADAPLLPNSEPPSDESAN